MKVGDKIPVTVAGAEVAQAEIKEVGDGTVTFIVPAKRVVMSVRTELDPTAAAPEDTSGTQHIVDEVIRAQQEALTPPQNASGADGQGQIQTGEIVADASGVTTSADKVISSSSVPTENPGDPQNQGVVTPNVTIAPEVQEQINQIVADHLAARAQAEADAKAQE